MNTDTAAEYLVKKLDEQRDALKEEIVRIALPHEEYARLRGVIQGLDFAMHTIKDLAQRVENDDV